jgi:hypothetical protein
MLIVTDMFMKIDQERQTPPRLAAFQAELRASRPFVPAGRRNVQPSSGKRWESRRQIEILDPRQPLFRQSFSLEFNHHRLPHFLPRCRTRRRARRRQPLFG